MVPKIEKSIGKARERRDTIHHVALLLDSHVEKKAGEQYSYLEKLVRGMPKRFAKCHANHFGRCGQ